MPAGVEKGVQFSLLQSCIIIGGLILFKLGAEFLLSKLNTDKGHKMKNRKKSLKKVKSILETTKEVTIAVGTNVVASSLLT
ncbi:hypothetical protein BN3087_660004 [Sulfurovum sp. enrichment culture clone C5]|uniref:Uncharacterized protein n=1 Tax=Sulfurovum sp. enrichment culture clone C5 TaxID=497650 RepID=A0A0S4XQ09_9BACT|nr:hypothetical protein BN3087_660004 [Sulfurovum sp. enrichment culture clone C5]